jgi:uncharacterized membrane protein HdeD (DUF308 family)
MPPATLDPRDAGHLNVLAIFHYVFGGLGLLGGCFLVAHYLIMHSVMSGQLGTPPGQTLPTHFFIAMRAVYAVMGFFILADMVMNILSAVFLQRRRHRVFSMVTAGVNCLQFPFGTVLGVFTLIVLMRESVREHYERRAQEN